MPFAWSSTEEANPLLTYGLRFSLLILAFLELTQVAPPGKQSMDDLKSRMFFRTWLAFFGVPLQRALSFKTVPCLVPMINSDTDSFFGGLADGVLGGNC